MDIQEEFNKLRSLPNKLDVKANAKQENIQRNASQPSADTMRAHITEISDDFLEDSNFGRPSLPNEEKAKPIPIRLHQQHLEKLEFIPGEGYAEKVRYLIDTVTELKSRERKQFKTLDTQIKRCYKLAIMIHRPEEFDFDESKRKKLKYQFVEEFKAMEAMVNLLGFSYGDLKRGLSNDRTTDIDIIFMIKDAL